ncbi:MAG: GNAT family N-acetyltransferase [Mesorhizobium sp.]|nr:GNAT family protein [Mesorhizobium sp.]MCO5160039.1 GNAT family N-acetyltransferase [Mesorhizobium sp.]
MFALPFLRQRLPALAGERVMLRPPVISDYAEWAAVRRESEQFLAPWEPKWASDELDRLAWRQRIRRYREEIAQGSGMPFLIFERVTGRLAGGITLGNIRHGVAQTGQIGYWMGVNHAGKGFMHEAVVLVVKFGFETLRLHRIEAACIPSNDRSIRVLEKAGFKREGLLRSYLRINGAW